jgi:hypothetical protein
MAVAASDLGELYQAECDADCEEQIVDFYEAKPCRPILRLAFGVPSPSPPSGDGHLVPARTPQVRGRDFLLGARRTLAKPTLRVKAPRPSCRNASCRLGLLAMAVSSSASFIPVPTATAGKPAAMNSAGWSSSILRTWRQAANRS